MRRSKQKIRDDFEAVYLAAETAITAREFTQAHRYIEAQENITPARRPWSSYVPSSAMSRCLLDERARPNSPPWGPGHPVKGVPTWRNGA